MIQEIAGSDADIEMVCRDVFVVLLKQTLRRAVPNQMVCQAKHDEVIQAQAAPGIDGLSGSDLFFRHILVFLHAFSRNEERNPHIPRLMRGFCSG